MGAAQGHVPLEPRGCADAVVCRRRPTAAYALLLGFTTAGLGYERGPALSNMVHKIDDAPSTRQYIQLFDQIWHNPISSMT